jgi:aldose 1-epimerase
MSFAIYKQQTNGFDTIMLVDNIGLSRVSILPETGAMLHSFEVQTDNGPFNIIDNYANPSILLNELNESFKSCKLSPFACRIPGGKYFHNEHVYTLQHIAGDGSSIHGLLYNKPFKVMDEFCDDSQAVVQLKYSYKKDDAGYPFEYRCEVRYTLMPGNLLEIQTTIINLHDETIPLADGWHPYFKLGGITDEWMLRINASSMLEYNEHLVPTGRLLPYNSFIEEQSLRGVVLDNSFLLNKAADYAACTLYNPSNNLSVSFFPDETYPYLHIYTPPGRNSIAIENLSGAPNCFNNKLGLIQLLPGHTKTFTVYYKTIME